jgi:hypothetical protein
MHKHKEIAVYFIFSPLHLPPLWSIGLISQFYDNVLLQTLGLLGRVISPSQDLYLNTGQHKRRINAYTHQTSMFYVGFEPTIPVCERAKTVHVLDRSATVTGLFIFIKLKINYLQNYDTSKASVLVSINAGNSQYP